MGRGFDCKTTLGICWSKVENDWRIYYPDKPDGWLLHGLLISDEFKLFLNDLEERGYDVQSLRLSVKRK